jgi:glycosyltransferase involved in cell wall biosynthesis
MKRVLQILYSGLGGHGSVAFSLADAAARAGAWENAFLFVGIEPTLAAYRRRCDEAGYRYAEVRTRPGLPWLAWPAVFAAAQRLQPDAVILHSIKTLVPNVLLARRRGLPLIAVEHQPNDLKSRAEWWVSRRAMAWADAVVVLTEDYRDRLRSALGPRWREQQVRMIPNGVDTDRFAPQPGAGAGAPLRLGMAARMTPSKRQDLLIEALCLAQAQGRSWQLSLAGDGPCRERLQAQAAQAGLAARVDFPGFLDEAALADWFSSLDVYLHASDGETLSTSLLQAMACGLPIVGADVPGIGNLLAQGGGVGVAAAPSARAFADAVADLADDAERARSLGARARALAVAAYSREAMFERYRALLESAWRR